MSGPKDVRYRIRDTKRQEIENQRRLQEQKDNRKILNTLREKVKNYKLVQEDKLQRVKKWLKEAESLNDRMQFIRNKVNGIQSYLERMDKLEADLRNKPKIIEEKSEELLEAEYLNDQISSVLKEKEIMNDGIKQRVEYFREHFKNSVYADDSIREQIKIFLDNVEELRQNLNKESAEKDFVKKTISSFTDGGEGKAINGVPFTFSVSEEGTLKKIIINIDESKGDCSGTLDVFNHQLNSAGIAVDSIKIQKTGRIIIPDNTSINTDHDRI